MIVNNVSRSVLAGQRIGILGANGQGKSTVVKTIARELPPIGGEITEGKGLNIGYFAQQELDVLRPADTPLEHMIRLERATRARPAREQDLRRLPGHLQLRRRHGQAGRGQHERRRKRRGWCCA